ncbi:auxin-responsive protein SAUR32-like [Phragmites australis]|uniref:auxin-responsive protein SAUR32-like n=1 Tax=Phragmites australis TaxID=29695 RepID=UPI002D7668EC|nr:auxin-responsive protein SAUR32-like [Phragmites australis]
MHSKQQQQQQQQGMAVAPKGCVTVRVGAEGEEQRRFAVPLGHLKHPLFGALLEEAEREYGFRHQGAIAIPCRVDRFVQVEHLIDQDLHGSCAHHLVDLDGRGGAGAPHHLHLPRFVGCFRA